LFSSQIITDAFLCVAHPGPTDTSAFTVEDGAVEIARVSRDGAVGGLSEFRRAARFPRTRADKPKLKQSHQGGDDRMADRSHHFQQRESPSIDLI
jgi:hypothetical protein